MEIKDVKKLMPQGVSMTKTAKCTIDSHFRVYSVVLLRFVSAVNIFNNFHSIDI